MTTPLATAIAPTTSYRMIRLGVAVVLAAVAIILLSVAAYYAINAVSLGTVQSEVPGTWGQAFRVKTVWPVLVWSTLFGFAAVVGVALLNNCPDDQPARLAQLLGGVFAGMAAMMALIPIYLLATRGVQLALSPLFVWGAVLFFLFLIASLLMFVPNSFVTLDPARLRVPLHTPGGIPTYDPVRFRLTVMAIGGVAGLVTVLLGFALPLMVYDSVLGKGLEEWRKNKAAVVWPALAVFGSLVLMFVSLQLGRGLERQNQNVRRVIYGYNALMTGLLLLAVLSLVNVLAYAEPFTRFFGRPFDWTVGNLNALSPATRNMLADLNEPVHVYSFMPIGDPIQTDTQTLLDNCRTLTPKFTWEHVSRSGERISAMMEKYSISDPLGILVVVGKEAEKSHPTFTFIKRTDLYKIPPREPRMGREKEKEKEEVGYTYLGESALLGALQSLLEGKMTLYLTQGHGEWSAEGTAPAAPRMGMAGQEGQLATLRRKLTERRGVEVKTITLDATTKSIPNDAAAVIIVRPTTPFGKEEIAVLRSYLRRNRQTTKTKDKAGKDVDEETVTAGKLMLLLEPIVQRIGDNRTLVRTGLEPLLAEYNVKLGENRIQALGRGRDPRDIIAVPVPGSANPIAKAFDTSGMGQLRGFQFSNVQTVNAASAQGPKQVEELLRVASQYVWLETDFNRDPVARAERLMQDPELLLKELQRKPVFMAVAVHDQGAAPGVPQDAVHGGLNKDTPRMVVFGTASWVGNDALNGSQGVSRMDFFNSSISWLREKTALGESDSATGKERKLYNLRIDPQQQTRLTFLPLGLMVLAIFCLGMGVWVVRRR